MSWLARLAGRKAEPVPPPDPEADLALARDCAAAGDHERALALWHPLARAGHPRAQSNIGACFAEGLGVERDPALARKWLTLAAESGDAVGQRNLAAFLFKGEAGEPDFAGALALYRKAAEQGDAEAQDMLSWMLLEGEEMAADPAGARLWAERAASQGVASSMTRLGMLHHNALGVARDPAEAVRWWRLGAERDDADGQAMLGAAHVLGAGAPRDPVAGLAWLLRAQAGGSALCAPFFPSARAALDPAGEAEAARRAAEPLPEPAPLPNLAQGILSPVGIGQGEGVATSPAMSQPPHPVGFADSTSPPRGEAALPQPVRRSSAPEPAP